MCCRACILPAVHIPKPSNGSICRSSAGRIPDDVYIFHRDGRIPVECAILHRYNDRIPKFPRLVLQRFRPQDRRLRGLFEDRGHRRHWYRCFPERRPYPRPLRRLSDKRRHPPPHPRHSRCEPSVHVCLWRDSAECANWRREVRIKDKVLKF